MKLLKFLKALKAAAIETWQELNLLSTAFVCISLGTASKFLCDRVAEMYAVSWGVAFGVLLIPMAMIGVYLEDRLKRHFEQDLSLTPTAPLSRFFFLLLPKHARERYLEPTLEDLNEDQIREEAEAADDAQRARIRDRFSRKIAGACLAAAGCALRDQLARFIPWLKKLFFGTGS